MRLVCALCWDLGGKKGLHWPHELWTLLCAAARPARRRRFFQAILVMGRRWSGEAQTRTGFKGTAMRDGCLVLYTCSSPKVRTPGQQNSYLYYWQVYLASRSFLIPRRLFYFSPVLGILLCVLFTRPICWVGRVYSEAVG
jgi:hypothetical protein